MTQKLVGYCSVQTKESRLRKALSREDRQWLLGTDDWLDHPSQCDDSPSRFQKKVRHPWFVRRLHLSPFPPDSIPRQLNQDKEIRTRYFGRKEENVQPYGDRGGLPKRRHQKRRVGRQSTHDTYIKHPRPNAGHLRRKKTHLISTTGKESN